MDIGNFYKNLDLTSKQLFLSIAVALPFAYIDCWKIYHLFKDLNLLPQLMMAFAIDLILVGLGFAISGIARFNLSEETYDKMMGFFVIINIIGFMGASMACVTINIWNPICIFLSAYILTIVLMWIIFRGISIKDPATNYNEE